MRTFTEKGRVVYDRKKHFFGISDFLRIAKKIDSIMYYKTPGAFDQVLADLAAPAFEPGEGEFGGGGVTRPFSIKHVAEDRGQRVIVIIEIV